MEWRGENIPGGRDSMRESTENGKSKPQATRSCRPEAVFPKSGPCNFRGTVSFWVIQEKWFYIQYLKTTHIRRGQNYLRQARVPGTSTCLRRQHCAWQLRTLWRSPRALRAHVNSGTSEIQMEHSNGRIQGQAEPLYHSFPHAGGTLTSSTPLFLRQARPGLFPRLTTWRADRPGYMKGLREVNSFQF